MICEHDQEVKDRTLTHFGESLIKIVTGTRIVELTYPGQFFHERPLPGWSNYKTPIRNLYLCGAGKHPGGEVTGAPGYNADQQTLTDLKILNH